MRELFLSRLFLDGSARAVQRVVGDCQLLHKLVMSGFPDVGGQGRSKLDVLHRLDATRSDLVLLVQSAERPQWESGRGEFLLDVADNPSVKRVDDAFEAIRSNVSYRFRLRANPTRKVKKDGARNGRRSPILGEDERLDWLERKGSQGGFALLGTRVRDDTPDVLVRGGGSNQRGTKRSGAGTSHALSFRPVTFDGRLRVVDADRLRETLRNGVGPAKAYGFGLLTLAK